MKKSRKPLLTVIGVLLGVLFIVTVGLVLRETAQNGWVIDQERATDYALVIVGLFLTLLKLITSNGRGMSLKKYESIYQKELGTAFSDPSQKKQKHALLVAIARYNESKYADASSRLKALVKNCRSRDDHKAVLLFLALTYTDAGMINDAISTYNELVRISPECSTAWSNLSLLYKHKGDQEKMLSCLETALLYNDQNAEAWNNLAQAYITMGKWEKVIDPALRALQIKFNLYQAEAALSMAYFALGDMEKSKQYFDSAVLHGEDADALAYVLNNLAQGKSIFGEVPEEENM